MDFDTRYKTTLKISGDLWQLYKKALNQMDKIVPLGEDEQDKWWDKTIESFHACIKPYIGTTHEYYANQYSVACMDDLNMIWKLKNIKKI